MEYKYLIDTNVLIAAHRQTYPMDIFPSFWEQLIDKGASKIIFLDKVYDEIIKNSGESDALKTWVANNKDNFENIVSSDKDIISEYSEIANEIQRSKRYKDPAKHEYFDVADSWICAAAKAKDLVIVTNEVSSNAQNRVKIPDVCEKFHIKYINSIKFIRELGMRF
ncbi:DUF4411 family protein [Peptoniphilus duerdenii]|uniref:DUF4411 family protein n=1 Tax=Peptoniphilus duerdenii TaxID=507750 RepID=UPI00288C023C|nr:DUF4411 family protein [Peptoniphilus duerdenii]